MGVLDQSGSSNLAALSIYGSTNTTWSQLWFSRRGGVFSQKITIHTRIQFNSLRSHDNETLWRHDHVKNITTYVLCNRAAASTRVVNYSSKFLILEYSLISISISSCKFPFPYAETSVFSRYRHSIARRLLIMFIFVGLKIVKMRPFICCSVT